jgi:hypothetical protein
VRKEDGMRTVTVRLRAADLSREMAAMREWLDRTRYEPTRFDCDQNGDTVVLSVDFRLAAAAEAFARRFDIEDMGRRGHRHPPGTARAGLRHKH